MRDRPSLGCLWVILAILLIGGTPLLVGILRVFAVGVIVAIGAGTVLMWWMRRHAVIQYTSARGAHSRRFVEILVALLVRLAEVDGTLDRREVTAIRHFFQYGLGYRGERLLWVRDLIKAARRGAPAVGALCEELRSQFGLQERFIVIQVLTRVAQADGALRAAERAFIEQVAQQIGLAAFIAGFGAPGFDDASFERGATGAHGDGRIGRALAELGLSEDASATEIKQAWRKLSLDNHPDRVSHLGEEFRKLAEERMRRINSAYDILKQAGRAA